MTLTREEILAMEPGESLDILVGKEIINETPNIEWWATDGEETGIFITFNYESEAKEWLAERMERFPHWVEREGAHIVRKEIFKRYSESISAAWEVEERIKALRLHTGYVSCLKQVLVGTGEYVGMFDYIHATAEQRCKAALLAVLNL